MLPFIVTDFCFIHQIHCWSKLALASLESYRGGFLAPNTLTCVYSLWLQLEQMF